MTTLGYLMVFVFAVAWLIAVMANGIRDAQTVRSRRIFAKFREGSTSFLPPAKDHTA
jgi:hypothetical protein